MNACNQEFLNKGCVCLADPLDPWTNICAYIDRQNGFVYPCDLGYCVPRCENIGQSQNLKMELHRTGGVELPEGYGANLPIGDAGPIGEGAKEALPGKEAKISSTQPTNFLGPMANPDIKVWQLLLYLLIFVAIILVAAGFLD